MIHAFNPFTFKVVIHVYDPITIFLIVLRLFCVGLFLLLQFLFRKVSFSICCKVGLMVLKSLNFCLSVKLLISLSNLNESLTE